MVSSHIHSHIAPYLFSLVIREDHIQRICTSYPIDNIQWIILWLNPIESFAHRYNQNCKCLEINDLGQVKCKMWNVKKEEWVKLL